ncbi:MAG: NAD(P)-dependent oxidoreductase [Erysipelotrichaceae bacterium]|nr:NAD(P)-dependent oxidoreductase [Erysipelotrichaceae bacterium]
MKILFIEMSDIEAKCKQLFAEFDIETYNFSIKNPSDIPLEEIEIVVGTPSPNYINLESLPKLRMIQLPSAGYDRIPLQQLKSRNITLANASGVYSIPIAEWVISKLLEIIKQSIYYYQNQSQNIWKKNYNMIELPNRKALIFGTGSIGQEIAKRLNAFDVIVDGINSNGRDITHFHECFDMIKGKEIAKNYDILIFSLPNNDETAGLVNTEFLKDLKQEAILINIGRGTLINETDLIESLKQGKFMGVALDVMSVEPLPLTSELWIHPKVIISPHSSFISDKIDQRRVDLISSNILAFYQGKPIINKII